MIKIAPLIVQGQDERGSNYNWDCNRTGNFILCYRNAGSTSGQHYHEGKSDNKNPEIMYLLSGTAKMHYCALSSTNIETIEFSAPARIEIPILIWHELEAVTDCSFIELNSLDDVKVDSVRIWRKDFEQGKR
ncbi:hypothetical protein LX64_01945 [Chitinophaga skermanii]|uniref:Cupin domain-containing protein n=1 Tax=Chitinophaga skermanii TaxID=331697 RepID=A0A327QS87_9BACT|nr:hypothetical protein [Chitinophaga skermanii]RAJ06818.1 hypothetical protein LX64_01945 [Chitinophaga skermanii]